MTQSKSRILHRCSFVFLLGCGGGETSTSDAGLPRGDAATSDASVPADATASSTDGSAGDDARSCDLRTSGMYCQEYRVQSAAVAAYRDACQQGGGSWAEAPCPRQDALGGCQSSSGVGTVTTWFYAGGPYAAREQAETACESGTAGDMFVDP